MLALSAIVTCPASVTALARYVAGADVTIVRHVHVSHQQIAIANRRGQTAAFGAAMDGYEFADAVAIADAGKGPFAMILLVLRSHPHRGVWIESIILTDSCDAFDKHTGHEPRAGANFHFVANNAIWPDFSGGVNARARVDNRCGMNLHLLRRALKTWLSFQLAHYFCLRYDDAVHQRLPGHFGDRALALNYRHFHPELISWDDRTPEPGGIHRNQKYIHCCSVFYRPQDVHSRRLRHGLYNQDSRHHWEIGKMPLEEWLIRGHVLDSDNPIFRQLNNPVHQQKRIAVRQNLTNFINVNKNGHGKPSIAGGSSNDFGTQTELKASLRQSWYEASCVRGHGVAVFARHWSVCRR